MEREQKEDEEVKLINKQNEEDNARLAIIESRLSLPADDEEAQFEDLDALQGEKDEIKERIAKREARVADINKRRYVLF